MNDRTAVIIVDTGFSLESMLAAKKILAVLDVRDGSVVSGLPYLSWKHNSDALTAFAGDPSNHGSMVLNALMAKAPHLPVILVRAYNESGLVRTSFKDGKIHRPGWTEAYLTAVHICKVAGLNSVANFSFGGYTHAADGTGWESFCLGSVTGPGKPGHIVVAGAGAGNGANIHSSWNTLPGQSTEVEAYQQSSATYNFWCGADANSPQFSDWLLEVFIDGRKIGEERGGDLIPNLWNNRRQVKFDIPGAAHVKIRTTRLDHGGNESSRLPRFAKEIIPENSGASSRPFHCVKKPSLSLVKKQTDAFRFDCWINQFGCDAAFTDHKDAMLIAEPAIFPQVICVGLVKGEYSLDQDEFGAKPDLLIEGDGPISFRLPEIAAEIAEYLAEDPTLDSVAVRNRVNKLEAVS